MECLEALIVHKNTQLNVAFLINIRQDRGKSVSLFFTRVSQHANNCTFKDVSILQEVIHMQIIEGCIKMNASVT